MAKGVERLRITGGEPLVRKNVMRLFERLGAPDRPRPEGIHPHHQWQPARRITRSGLYDAGVRRVNVSLDTRDPGLFRRITRWGELDKVMAGIEAAAQGRASSSRSTPWR